MPQRVLGIVATHENGALAAASGEDCQNLCALGYAAEIIDLSLPPGKDRLTECLATNEVEFCFGYQGVGSQLKRGELNLWADTRIPFISLHFDNPCFNPDNHSGENPYVVNLYHFESFLDIQRRYIGGNAITGLLPYEIILQIGEEPMPFSERPIKYLFLKSGGQLDEYIAYFKNLPTALREGVNDLLNEAQRDPNLFLCGHIENLLSANGYDLAAYRTQFWAVVYAVESYLRRKRAIDFVNWLKFKPGAVIMGDGWDFIDRQGTHAKFLPAQPIRQAGQTYKQTQFVCNTNPYGRDVIHERIPAGLFWDCCVLTDTNAWWDNNFSNVPALIGFSWDQPLDDQLNAIMNNPMKAREAAATGRDPTLKRFTGHYNILKVIAYAKQVRLAIT